MFLNRIKSSSESRWARVEAMVGRVYSALSKSPSFSMTRKRIIFLFEGGTQGGTFFYRLHVIPLSSTVWTVDNCIEWLGISLTSL